MDEFLRAALEEAEAGFAEGGIPIGSVLVHQGRILGRGHNRRVQKGSAILHGEMDALENAGRQPAKVYQESILYTTLSPCAMCTGAILLYGIPHVIVGENKTFKGEEGLTWVDAGGRVFTQSMKELAAWRGNRGDAGRVRPDRFLTNNKFGQPGGNGKGSNGG